MFWPNHLSTSKPGRCLFLVLCSAVVAVVCRQCTRPPRLCTCQRQVRCAASGECVLPADALAAHEHPHLRALHPRRNGRFVLSGSVTRAALVRCQYVFRRPPSRVPAGLLAGWLAGVFTPLLEICSVQDYCIRPGTSSTVPVLSQSCQEGCHD